jgi:hypothetical protein
MAKLKLIISWIFVSVFIISIVFNILFLFRIISKDFLYTGFFIIVLIIFLISLFGIILKIIRKDQYVKINIVTSAQEIGKIFVVVLIIWVVTYFLAFLGYSETIYAKDGSKILHNQSEFYDLDFDGIPEIITNIYAELKTNNPAVEYRLVYKLYDGVYEVIGILDGGENYERLYINPNNKIVSVNPNSTQFFEIKDKEIVYSPYIDSTGSDSYNGVKYDEIGGNSNYFQFNDYKEYINCEVFLTDLSRIPKLEYSDVLNVLKKARSK